MSAMRIVPLAMLLLAGCNFEMASASPRAQEAAANTISTCRNVCPAGTAAMAITTFDSSMSTHWTCGCLDLSATRKLEPKP